VNYDDSLVVTITVTCNLWAPSSGDHFIYMWRHLPAATSLLSPLAWNSITYHLHFNSQFTSSTLSLRFKTIFNGGCYWEGLWPFSQVPYWAPFVAVDCIGLNYWGKHKRKMAIRRI